MAKRKKLAKKYVFRRFCVFIILIALIGGAGWYFGSRSTVPEEEPDSNDDTSQEESQRSEGNDDEDSNSEPEPEPEPEIEPDPEPERPQPNSDDSWSLLLANPSHPVPDGYEVELATVYGEYKVDARIVDAALQMFNQARLDGITIFPCSAYRAKDYQQGLFDNKVQQYIAQGYEEERAVAATAQLIAVPGTSEHQTGLAMDIVTTEHQDLNEGFADTPAFRWLDANAYKYGFILRYPQNKTGITQISYEPWHYRYVGVEHAKIIKERGLCLEEYLHLLETGGLEEPD